MLINSLEKMETIVENNKTLSWDGWTVVENNSKENGTASKNGKYVNNKWITQKRYECSVDGWDIPEKFLR